MPDGQADKLFVQPTRTDLIEIYEKGERGRDARQDCGLHLSGETVHHPCINHQMGRVVRDQEISDLCILRVERGMKGPKKRKNKADEYIRSLFHCLYSLFDTAFTEPSSDVDPFIPEKMIKFFVILSVWQVY